MEANDMKAMREALAPFPSLCEWLIENAAKLGISDMVTKLRERGDKARAALAAPPRQCDVGSAKEQEDRFNKYCRGSNYCAVCPIRKLWDFRDGHSPSCTILWSQMPYEAEEGGAR